jgi:threonine aldolase
VRPADLTWRAGVDVLSFGGTKNGMNTTEAIVFFNRGARPRV